MPLNTKNQWHFLKRIGIGSKVILSMLKMPYFLVLSIGMKFIKHFRCRKFAKMAKKASETD